MVTFRKKFHERVAAENIDGRLVLNYDQVWRLKWRGRAAVMWKNKAQAGKKVDPLQRMRAKRQQRAHAKRKAARKEVVEALGAFGKWAKPLSIIINI